MHLIDTHSHFDNDCFDADRSTVWQRALDAGVKQHIIPAVEAAHWPRLRSICSTHAGTYPAYGLHPVALAQHKTSDLDALETWLAEDNVVAVGECGLDFYLPDLDQNLQIDYFAAQLAIAKNQRLPVIIHACRAVDEVLKYLRRANLPAAGVVHSFSGSMQQAKQLIDLGFMLGFGGPVTYERAQRLRKLVTNLPLDSIVLESDAPDQPPSQYRGQRNEPAYIHEVLQTLAELRQEDPAVIAAATTKNAISLFDLPA